MGEITLKDVRKYARKIGAKVEDDKIDQTHECRVEAPHRKIWSARFVHEIIESVNRPWKPDYADVLDSMKFGLEDCTDPDCDWCNSEEQP